MATRDLELKLRVPVRQSAAVPWRTIVIATDESGLVSGAKQTVVVLGNQPRFADPHTEQVRRQAVLEAIDIVRRGLGQPPLGDLDWELWGS